MIRPLRRAHRVIWAALAAALPLLVWISLAARTEKTPRNPGVHWGSSR
jgi:hypothetical protein